MMAMAIPYEESGRREQKGRTRAALVAATRQLLADGVTPTVEQVATSAGISRTTAYRYFANQRDLLIAAYPEISQRSLLSDPPPPGLEERFDATMRAFIDITLGWEAQLRTALRLSLETSSDKPALRQGRAIGWIEEALAPLRGTHPSVDIHQLAVAIRSATGIEAFVWLTDVAGLTRRSAADLMLWSARTMLAAARTNQPPPKARRSRG
jgi:AcrR family transcriptional regulator